MLVDLPRALPRWAHLVTPRWLAALVDGRPVVAGPAPGWRLIEVGFGTHHEYLAGHVPGADYLDTVELEQAPLWNKVPDGQLLEVLLSRGIGRDTPVLLYARNALCAARAAHLMLYAGVRDVRWLDGGWAAWTDAGGRASTCAPPRPSRLAAFGGPFPAHPEYLVDLPQARELACEESGLLVSIRSWAEHTGICSGYDYIAQRGDIPGARWGRAGRDGDAQCMRDYHLPDGTMRPAREIQAFWHEAGIQAGRRTAFYCGTGWRASLAFFYAWLMDWRHISVFDGGWLEWSAASPP